MQTTTRKPPSVEILFLRHSKARYVHFRGVSVLDPQRDTDRFRRANVNLLAGLAKRWGRK